MGSARSVYFLVALMLPLAFTSLGSPAWFGLALLLTLPNLASSDPNLQSASFQYGAPLMPMMFLAAAGTLRKLPEWVHERAPALVGALAVTSFVVLGPPATQALSAAAVAPDDTA